jgi:hypothetical protein
MTQPCRDVNSQTRYSEGRGFTAPSEYLVFPNFLPAKPLQNSHHFVTVMAKIACPTIGCDALTPEGPQPTLGCAADGFGPGATQPKAVHRNGRARNVS